MKKYVQAEKTTWSEFATANYVAVIIFPIYNLSLYVYLNFFLYQI